MTTIDGEASVMEAGAPGVAVGDAGAPAVAWSGRERPILFSAPMVRALLAGTKTQTRRKYKPRAPSPYEVIDERDDGRKWPMCEYPDTMNGYEPVACPYGEVGDRLWVRETWATYASLDRLSPSDLDPVAGAEYLADGARRGPSENFVRGKTRVSIHMPRWASRLTLEITNVRFERLQDISEADAEAEGIDQFDADAHTGLVHAHAKNMGTTADDPRASYAALWTLINGSGSWEANRHVWVVSFRVLA